MDDLTATALHSMIYKQFESWDSQDDDRKEIEDAILYGLEKKDSMERIFVKMLFNAMKISAEISAKIIFEILLTAGVVKPADERQLRKDILFVVKENDPGYNADGDRKED